MIRKLNEQKFCGWCGGILTYTSEWAGACSSCNYVHYSNPKPCCSILVVSEGSILMVQRAIEPQFGKFDFPGGYMDMADDSMEECAYRELNEEVGLERNDIGPLTYIGSGISPYVWHDSELITAPFYFVSELQADISSLKVDPGENSQVRWVQKNDIKNIDFAWEIDKRMITKYMEDSA